MRARDIVGLFAPQILLAGSFASLVLLFGCGAVKRELGVGDSARLAGGWGRLYRDSLSAEGWGAIDIRFFRSGGFVLVRRRLERMRNLQSDPAQFEEYGSTGWRARPGFRVVGIDSTTGTWEVQQLRDGRSICLLNARTGDITCVPFEVVSMRWPGTPQPTEVRTLFLQSEQWNELPIDRAHRLGVLVQPPPDAEPWWPMAVLR